ncbi:MAG: AsmA family protein [Pseudolabrys sp.]
MQTTLLGLAIAIILALVAALVGPLLVDWGNHRALFEAEASRLIGVNVRVAGAIDARLLPSPRLTLHDITIGDGRDTIRAQSLGAELALGPLMRGEWRAAEMRFASPQISFGLDASGRVRAPNLVVAFKPDELSVDRLSIEDGTVILTNEANGASVTLGRVSFNGEARSLVGPVKGEGAVTIAGQLYPYRVALGRLSDDGTLKLHVNIDPVYRPLGIEADGALAFAGGEPHFDGMVSLSRPVSIDVRGAAQPAQTLSQPWRVSGKIKATGQSALMENVEFQYGSEEQGLKLTGVADFKFGTRPRFNGILSGRQVDLDRAISGADATRQPPAAAIRKLVELGAAAFRTAVPIQIGVGIDQVTLGGSSLQNVRGDISSNTDGWDLDRLEFRAPGMTQVRLSGRLDVRSDGVAFNGPAEIDASDPKLLAAWLEGRSETPQGDLRPMSLRGDVMLTSDKIAVEGLKADFDRKPITGRLTYFFPSAQRPARLDAELKAPQFDIDAALDFGRALLAGSALERPREIDLAADIGRATLAGIEARDARARIRVDANGLRIDRLSVGDFAGGSFAASGRVETGGHSPRGTLSLDVEGKQSAITAMIGKFAPITFNPAVDLLDRVGRVKLHGTLDVAGDDRSPVTTAQLALAGDLDDLRIDARARIQGDWNKPSATDVRIDGTFNAPQAAALVRLMSLDRIVAAGNGPGQLKVQVGGPVNGDMTFEMRLSADGLSAQANGSGQFSERQGMKAAGTLQVAEADLRPLRPVARPANPNSLPLRLTSRVAIASGITTFDAIDANLAGSRIHGRLTVSDASPRQVDGVFEVDTADLPALIAPGIGLPPQASVATGSAWSWSSEPFGTGLLSKFAGKVALKFGRADLVPQLTVRELNATLRFGKDELAFEDAAGALAGGRISGGITFRSTEDGLTARAAILLAGADAAALWSSPARPPIRGSLGLTAEMSGAGLSPVALIGSLKGNGKIVLTNAQIAGLDPRTFDAVTRAVDQGLAIEPARISDLVGKSLDSGQLSIKRAESTISVNSGQIRLSDVSMDSKNATLSAAGTLDLTDGSIGARLALSGSTESAGARPSIFIALKGPLAAPTRTIDVTALTGWLTLRAVENQTKRLRAIENVPPQPRGRGTPKVKQAPALPAPIDITPAPAPRSAGPPAASVRSQN